MAGADFFLESLRQLVQANASDLHVKANEFPRIRVQRKLAPLETGKPSSAELEGILSRYLHESQKKQLASARSVDFAFSEERLGRFRVNAFYQKGELALVARRVKDHVPDFDELALPPVLKQISLEERGLVLVAGPVGSGKSTTTAAIIDSINRTKEARVITLEDPIEFLHRDEKAYISQREIGLDAESFLLALRYVVRQDPDVILIGEIRDAETLHASLAASETGRLVISTVHGKNVSQAIERILGFFPRTEHNAVLTELSYNLKAVVAQRLLRRKDAKGLTPACEILLVNAAAAKVLREARLERLAQVMQNGIKEGMQPLNHSLLELVEKGVIDKEEAFAASDHPQALEMNLKGIFLDESGGGILGT